ncbi:hypothetical protein EON63_08815 [archaeon]|nr:MAG: hypothetical protein EON63_08815 [archaeon]
MRQKTLPYTSYTIYDTPYHRQELMAMLEEEELKDAILLVFANKQDSKGALNSRAVCAWCVVVCMMVY